MNKKIAQEIFSRFQKANPHPTTELTYGNAFELLIAVILSAQATDKSVNKVTLGLFKAANTPAKLLALGEDGLIKHIRSIGLYQTKARNIIRACQLLVDEFHSTIPDTREALESLPGVGRKTANVMLNTYFGHATMAVDTHIFRVANRIGLTKAKNRLETEKQLLDIIPEPFLLNAHHWLILHGRYTCTARKPRCPDCLIRDLCEYPDKTI